MEILKENHWAKGGRRLKPLVSSFIPALKRQGFQTSRYPLVMVTAQLQGGLGNQLFQIAAATALAWRNGTNAAFDLSAHCSLGQGRTPASYCSTIFSQLVECRSQPSFVSFYEQKNRPFSPIPYRPGIKLYGFFHAVPYFKDFEPEIKALFVSSLVEPVELLRRKYSIDLNTCAIAVRRGDYLTHPELATLDFSYYLAAMAKFPAGTKFVVVSDDLAWCHQVFVGTEFTFSTEQSDWLDFCLIAACSNQIIANSTFSWWASYLAPNRLRMPIAPLIWTKQQPFGAELIIHQQRQLELT